jgi:hypothetical protein
MIAPASGVYGGADPLADNTSRFFVQVKFNFHLREIMITTVRHHHRYMPFFGYLWKLFGSTQRHL